MNDTGLYSPSYEHDACGIGFVANLKGKSSNEIIHNGLDMLVAMDHRGGCGCDKQSGDGAGILIKKPHAFFQECLKEYADYLVSEDDYGIAQLFLPKDVALKNACKAILSDVVVQLGCTTITYREVLVNNSSLGQDPLATEPDMEQLFIAKPLGMDLEKFERKLFVIRRYATRRVHKEVKGAEDIFYIVSCSYKTIGYKGQFNNDQIKGYYLDFHHKAFASPFILAHSRFSTNTFPQWKLAQPFRYIAHNGEINTIKGNVACVQARQALLKTTAFTQEEMEMLFPLCDPIESDSCNLDKIVEMLVLSGRSLAHTMMMLIPEAWQEHPHMEKAKRAFYQYYAHLMEPWDGPASLCFTDGHIVGATLDRNGLRPSRYCLTRDGMLIMSSEVGVLPIDPAMVVERGRLQPGKIFIADLKQGRIITDEELKQSICTSRPYEDWINTYEKTLGSFLSRDQANEPKPIEGEALLTYQQAFGYTTEEIKVMITSLATKGTEPLGSMGLDVALPVLSHHAQHISNYFKQLFAQVTNPPIDPIRERLVMSLFSYLGTSRNILEEEPEHCKKIRLNSPILTNKEMALVSSLYSDSLISSKIDIVFEVKGGKGTLEKAIQNICRLAKDKINEGSTILVLSDRKISELHAPIPYLMALGAVHSFLIAKGLRMHTSLVLESADVRETHHVATAIGYGANAINPYLALDTIHMLFAQDDKKHSVARFQENFIKGLEYGLRKILSKMGISTLQSYHGAHIFEALGIAQDVIDRCFEETPSRIGGLSFDDFVREVLGKHSIAFRADRGEVKDELPVGGIFQWKQRGEYHLFNPKSIHYLQEATRRGDYELYKKYAKEINNQSKQSATLRGLLTFKKTKSTPLAEVEDTASILKRFATGAMSFGSISHEAHSTLAIAMNRIGAKSNSGEGGEDSVRYQPKPNGDSECSSIKQVASGRFGVTSYYLSQAKELQIKMAQGAKPGEGGQLPGHKVDEWIGRVRHSTPGVGLISPPPHHDIYSIEDLAQLIFDLKNANRNARVSVKLVSEAGVGTVAAGVTKGYADVVLIAGHDGGTGASPLTSIRHAGLPWELGLSETHQTLVRNGLRSRVIVQADGQMKTGRDLAVATLLGAEEWGVATAALVVEGCILMRKCHLNTCPVGIATQKPLLRKRFAGKPEHVVQFFHFLAEELRELMSELGFRTVNEMVGKVEMLRQRDDITHWKSQSIRLDKILTKQQLRNAGDTLYCSTSQEDLLKNQLDWQFIKLAHPAIKDKKKVRGEFTVTNLNRAVGAMLSHDISINYGEEGLPDDTIHMHLRGSAGQSFGAFLAKGVTLELEGEANDYVGKGLSGGRVVVYPFEESTYLANENMIIGNVCLYGATSGEMYVRGLAGERFAVRNSGANVVVEGVGDHGCEYMTGGNVVILGHIGRNFAAGMSGGIAYVYARDSIATSLLNMETIDINPLTSDDYKLLRRMIDNHHTYTSSVTAEKLLAEWDVLKKYFIKVMPKDYKSALQQREKKQKDSIIAHG